MQRGRVETKLEEVHPAWLGRRRDDPIKEGNMKKIAVALVVAVLASAGMLAAQDKVWNKAGVEIAAPGVSYELKAVDGMIGVAKVLYRVNNGEVQEYAAPLTFKDEGSYTIMYYSEDLLGNVSAPQVFSFVVDATAPALTKTTRGPAALRDGKLYVKSTTGLVLRASDRLSGLAGISFSLDKENFIKYNDEAFINEEGAHTAWAYAEDRVGNRSELLEIAVVVDNTAPQVAITPLEPVQAVGGERYTNLGNSFIARATDDVSGVASLEVSVDRQEFFAYAEPVTFAEAGYHSIRARAVDSVGNVSPVVELSFVIDATAPGVNLSRVAAPKAQEPAAAPAEPAAAPQAEAAPAEPAADPKVEPAAAQ